VRPRALALALVLLVLAGCGGSGEHEGTATLWVTRDRGATVLLDTQVPAGQTLMRALASRAEIETRYGGRYLQSLEGLEGSLERQRDWFWFVNGYEGDRSAAEYRLRDGDVAWWDYRGWKQEGEATVVVGAFPEPFLHGYAGRTRRAVVRYAPAVEVVLARQLAADIHARPDDVQPLGVPAPRGANVLVLRSGRDAFAAELLGQSAGDPVRFTYTGEPKHYAKRYEVTR
jgi:Domain of unknown function (DUF4430)